jgi:glycosyltransferase involved in cell wall biosynthesis
MVILATKRLLRPLIPDRVMARYRLHQHSRHSRSNIDVFLRDRRQARRWLVATPDTFRVRFDLPVGKPEGEITVFSEQGGGDGWREMAEQVLADSWLDAAVVAEVEEPRLVGRRRVEPVMGPLVVAVRRGVLGEVGGPPGGDHPLPGLLARIRDAGHPIGLLPVPVTGSPTHRSDPIDSEAIVIMAMVPMHDIGGGARSTQLALEFLRQGYHVTLIALFEAQESVDLGLRHINPRLEQYRIRQFDPSRLGDRVKTPGMVIVEAPARPLIEAGFILKEAGWHLIYDVIDDWSDPALGGEWFNDELERVLVTRADRVMASAPDLVDRVWRLGREATLVPNAVNAEIFGVDLPPRPLDLPEAEVIIGYHGSLYGDWFDWEALRAVAEAHPGAAVVVIGDDKAARPEMPANVHFLGLKPQSDLPAYLQRFDVGVLPFKVGDTTHAVSPLKVYEYLASGVPVAAPPLRSLEGLEGVVTGDVADAVERALGLPKPERGPVLSAHAWEGRARQIVGQPSTIAGLETRLASRSVRHWARRERLAERLSRTSGERARG